MHEDCWLILNNKDECEKLVARLRKKNQAKQEQLGVPISLSDGQWAQCVEGYYMFLTNTEKKQAVSFASFKNKIMIA
jgi:hypothetical protein